MFAYIRLPNEFLKFGTIFTQTPRNIYRVFQISQLYNKQYERLSNIRN